MNWREKYELVLKNICERPHSEYPDIVELPGQSFNKILVENPKADAFSTYRLKLDEGIATEKDYKAFVEYIFAYTNTPNVFDL